MRRFAAEAEPALSWLTNWMTKSVCVCSLTQLKYLCPNGSFSIYPISRRGSPITVWSCTCSQGASAHFHGPTGQNHPEVSSKLHLNSPTEAPFLLCGKASCMIWLHQCCLKLVLLLSLNFIFLIGHLTLVDNCRHLKGPVCSNQLNTPRLTLNC